MTTLYKLTDRNDCTRGGMQWGVGVTHAVQRRYRNPDAGLCSAAWIHSYTDPLLAAFLNPIHADFSKPHLWRAEGEIGKTDHGLKVGCVELTTVRRLRLSKVTTVQRVAFGILCAREVFGGRYQQWDKWAADWLNGKDRGAAAAFRALAGADDVVYTAAYTTDARRAARAGDAAVDAAVDAANAVARAGDAAVDAAVDAASAVARAGDAAILVGAKIDLIALAKKAMKY